MSSIAYQVAAIVALLAANAFFVAAEFALVSARNFRLEPKARAGNKTARLTLSIKGDIDAYLSACQLGITMASLGLGWLGEPAVAALLTPVLSPLDLSAETLHTIAFVVGFIVFSSLHIVVGEQVPKTYAIRKAESIAMLLAYPLHWFYRVIFPLSWLLNWSSRAILRSMNVREASHADVLTSDELRGLIHVSAEHGEVAAERAAMLHNLFQFDERTVERVMIPRLETQVLRLDALGERNLNVIRKSQYSRFPVLNGELDDLVGIVLVRDLMNAIIDGTQAPWQNLEAYCRDPLAVPESLKVTEMFDMMRETRSHMACVIDEYGAFSGVVTLEDLLEEIVGEISDETDKIEPVYPIIWKETYWEAHGLAPLADLERETSFQVEEPMTVNTISGLIMSELSRLPVKGDTVNIGEFKFTVLAMKDRHVEKIRIETMTEVLDSNDLNSEAKLPETTDTNTGELKSSPPPLKGG
ncbi:hemolysin family protein [Sneathiella sp.]|uniref:hemolysin family protein n=1 Tax=Sneathiella sp. TaxID=1964365 RepID=UPI002604D127|nr:hemolysin family protein [Sneathiella sp.]MDF2368959.1 hemolysin family protein [Sneathiella sp.]